MAHSEMNTGESAPAPWWKTSVDYQIYPRSFCDTAGNGIGDLDGIEVHLDHVSQLGVDALWISSTARAEFDGTVQPYEAVVLDLT